MIMRCTLAAKDCLEVARVGNPFAGCVSSDGSVVTARDSDGSLISEGTAGEDDDAVRDAAIAACDGFLMLTGTLQFFTPISISQSNLEIFGDPSTIIQLMADVSAIDIQNDAANLSRINVHDIKIEAFATQTAPIVNIIGDGKGISHSKFSNLYISTANHHGATAIHLSGETSGGGYIYNNIFRDIYIGSCDIGLNLKTDAGGWIHGNAFENITVGGGYRILINFEKTTTGYGAHQNHFRFIQGQSVAYSTDMIRNITARNSFIDCVVYDTHHADNFQYLYHISDKDGTINVLPHGILIMAQGLATTAYTSSNIYDPGTNPAILLPGYPAVGD